MTPLCRQAYDIIMKHYETIRRFQLYENFLLVEFSLGEGGTFYNTVVFDNAAVCLSTPNPLTTFFGFLCLPLFVVARARQIAPHSTYTKLLLL